MEPTIKLLIVAGARPNFMKIAPITKAIEAHNATGTGLKINSQVVHTGQHYDKKMSDIFFTELGIPNSGRKFGSRTWIACRSNGGGDDGFRESL